jgi:23S rRNA pseudouridine2605 synthase
MSPEKSPRQPRKPFQNLAKKERTQEPFKKNASRSESRGEKPFKPKKDGDKPFRPRQEGDKPFRPKKDGDKPFRPRQEGDKQFKPRQEEDKPFRPRKEGDKPFRPRKDGDKRERPYVKREKPFQEKDRSERPVKRVIKKLTSEDATDTKEKKYAIRSGVRIKASKAVPKGVRLNKFIANSGICSRREADQLIQAGVIKINGEVVTAMGSHVMPGDKVQYGDQTLSNEKKRYILLNKQKGYVTTTKDPHAKNTVMELIAGACKERVYPVGRLDRNTTGLLLFTNDGELAKKLMHPRSRIKKMYHVVLDQPLSKADMVKIAGGIDLEGEHIQIDSIAYVEDAPGRKEVGMEIHSGQNRVVRRIFESLGYKVSRLDRVMYAGLTKKNLPRGKWRFLNEKELISLIMAK